MKLIVARNKNNVIGSENKLLWRLKDDLINFKKLTTDNIIIMGRKTFESIGNKPLPNRFNFVITKQKNEYTEKYLFDNLIFGDYNDLKIYLDNFIDKDIYVIGGSQIYQYFIDNNLIDEIILTQVDDNLLIGDSHFEFDEEKFRLDSIIEYDKSEHNEYSFIVKKLLKK